MPEEMLNFDFHCDFHRGIVVLFLYRNFKIKSGERCYIKTVILKIKFKNFWQP